MIVGVGSHENPKVSPFVRSILDGDVFGSGLKGKFLYRSCAVVDAAKLKRKDKFRAGLGELHDGDIVCQRIAYPANLGGRTRSRGPTEQASANCGARQEHGLVRAKRHGVRIFVSGRMAHFKMNRHDPLPSTACHVVIEAELETGIHSMVAGSASVSGSRQIGPSAEPPPKTQSRARASDRLGD